MRPLALLAAAPALVGGLNTPMNIRPYTISPVSAAKANPEAKAPPFRGEWFEVYGHWQNTTYSQVDWHGDPVPLPADIVKRFDGKVMAVVGFESTLVRQSATGAEELVPTTQLYNHHYSGSMSGKHAKRAAWPEGVTPIRGTHGNVLPYYELDESGSTLRQPSGERFPFIQSFSEGNGEHDRALTTVLAWQRFDTDGHVFQATSTAILSRGTPRALRRSSSRRPSGATPP